MYFCLRLICGRFCNSEIKKEHIIRRLLKTRVNFSFIKKYIFTEIQHHPMPLPVNSKMRKGIKVIYSTLTTLKNSPRLLLNFTNIVLEIEIDFFPDFIFGNNTSYHL